MAMLVVYLILFYFDEVDLFFPPITLIVKKRLSLLKSWSLKII